MKLIHKYYLEDKTKQEIYMPVNPTILTAQAQGNKIVLWCIVDPNAQRAMKKFSVVDTNEDLGTRKMSYISTVQIGSIVHHVFEVL